MLRLAMVLLGALAFAGLNEAAHAADARIVTKAPPITKAPPKVVTKLGLHVGINGGYGWNRATIFNPLSSRSIDSDGGLLGLTFGYNAQSGAVVYGVETDIAAAWMKSTNWVAAPCFGCEVGLKYFGTLRGRLGYAVGNALPYATAGLAYGGIKTTGLIGASETDTRLGWTAGAGLEYAIAYDWSVKGEYLYFDLGKTGCSVTACGLPPVTVKYRGNIARAGINYRF